MKSIEAKAEIFDSEMVLRCLGWCHDSPIQNKETVNEKMTLRCQGWCHSTPTQNNEAVVLDQKDVVQAYQKVQDDYKVSLRCQGWCHDSPETESKEYIVNLSSPKYFC
jgi:hypothetical protein